MQIGAKAVLIAASIAAASGGGYWLALSRTPHTSTTTNQPIAPVQSTNQSKDLTCGSEEAKSLAMEVIQRNPPKDLIEAASVSNRQAMWDDCNAKYSNSPTDPDSGFGTPASHCRGDVMRMEDAVASEAAAKGSIAYTVKNIRLQSKDQTTGAIACNVTVVADIPKLGSAEEEISYKLEKMEDGGVHIDVTGLH